MKDYCEHCWPTRRKYHFRTKIDYLFNVLNIKISGLLPDFLDEIMQRLDKHFKALIFNFLSIFRIVTFEEDPDFSQLRNRSLIFWKEAKKRNLEVKQVKILSKPTNYFRLNSNYYEAIPLTVHQSSTSLDDKLKTKQLLKSKNIPVPEGDGFLLAKKALNYAQSLEFPLVVKPRFGSLSEHVTWNIKNRKELEKAIKIAKQYQPGFLVEEHLEGPLYRVTVIKDKVFICKKEPANVKGDGQSTIKQLINKKNENPFRGKPQQKNTTLHEIPTNKRLIKNLKEQNLTLDYVPKKEEKVYLHRKVILAEGCDIIELTEQVPTENKVLFKKAAQALKSNLVGFDFITSDITVPYQQQKNGIIEANSLPYVDMHQFPSKGKPQPIAETGWDKRGN